MRVFLSIILILAIAVSSGYAETKVINISVYFIKESTKLFDISAEYPQIDKVEPEFNDKIRSLVEARIGDFKKASEDNWRSRKETSAPDENLGEYPKKPFYFDISWEPVQLNSKYISFVLHLDLFAGGANANQVVFAFNYDLLNNKEIMLNDLLGDYPDYLKTISDYSIKELESNIAAEGNADILKEMINEGAGPKEDNFRNFTFTDKAITLYFSKYDVLPGYFGEQEVHIPRSIFRESNLTIVTPQKFSHVKFPLEVKGIVEKKGEKSAWVIFKGEAGNIKIVDEDGQTLGTGILKAEGEWMSDDIVKVSCKIALDKTIKGKNIKLVITENNPDDTRQSHVMILPLIIASE